MAYALVAYKTAYLKAHYPVDFLAATLSAEIGSTDGIVKVIGDCVEMGIPVLPPDINESRKAFTAVGDAIRFGLAAIKGVGDAAAEAILAERESGPFASFTDFAFRLESHLINKRTVDALIVAGAFDSLGKRRATLAAASERVIGRRGAPARGRRPGPVEPLQPGRGGGRTTARRLPGDGRNGRSKIASKARRTSSVST